tara:strand:- start:81 stop:326 length:246 start_codon:yes stop_codon:yes gene_type:complete
MTSSKNNKENNQKVNLETDSELPIKDEDQNNDDSSNIEYTFGWNNYSEITNGRFAMIGLLSILLIELISKKSFLNWCGLIN